MVRDQELRTGLTEWRRLLIPFVAMTATAAITFAVSWGGVTHDQRAQAKDIDTMKTALALQERRLSDQEGFRLVIEARLLGIEAAQKDMNGKLDAALGEPNVRH